MEADDRRPSRLWYALAGLIMAAGIGAFLWLLISLVMGMGSNLHQVIAPGEGDLWLEQPGRYTIFHEYRTVVDGQVFLTDSPVPPLTVKVRSDRAEIPVTAPTYSETYTYGSRSGRSILTFTIVEPGPYQISARFPEGATGPPVVLAVGQGAVTGMFVQMLKAIGAMFGGMLLGGGLFAYTLWARNRRSRA